MTWINDRSLDEILRDSDTISRIKKETEESLKKKQEEEKAKKPPTFSVLETFSLITIASFVVGPIAGYLYLTLLIKFIEKLGVVLPLIQK